MKNNHFLFNIITIILLSGYSGIGYSQPTWYKTFGSWNEGEQAQKVVQTFDGGYLVLTLQGTGSDYYNIIKLDNSGNLLWRKLLADSSNKQVYEFQQTLDSGFIFTGRCMTSPWGGFLIKTDKNGIFKWQKNYTNLSYQTQFSTVKQTSDKGFICCGFYVDLINGGSKGVAVKTDSLGNVQWEKQYLDSLLNEYSDIIQDSSGNYYLTGNIFNTGYRVYGIVKKLLYNGNIAWSKVYFQNTQGMHIFQMRNSSLIIVGRATYVIGFPRPIIAKLDTSSNVKWVNIDSFPRYYYYSCKDNFDNIVITGGYEYGSYLGFGISKVDSSGILKKDKIIQFTGYNFIGSQCIKPTNDLGFIISGSVALLDTINNPHHFSLIVKADSAFNTPIITKIINNSSPVIKDFKLFYNYPNPFNSSTIIKFSLPNNGSIEVNIFNVLGKKVFSKKKYFNSGLNEYKIDFSEQVLSSGVYFVQFNFESNSKLIKVIYLK